MSYAGWVRSVTAVTMPSRPSPTAVSCGMVTSSPPAVTSSYSVTAAARHGLPSPEPWVPVAQAPATEMCGSEPRLCSARPARSSGPTSSPNRVPALTVTVSPAISSRGGRSCRLTRSPRVSATRLNECPVPSARIRSALATIPRSSSTDRGRNTRRAPNSTFPPQFRPVMTASSRGGRRQVSGSGGGGGCW